MERIGHIIKSLLPLERFDALGVGIIDFNKKTFSALEANTFDDKFKFKSEPTLYFDLASLTKPLTNSLSYFLRPEHFEEKMLWLLSHRSGLPSWGILGKSDWREQLQGYGIKESETLYSDFGALRLQIEFEKKAKMKDLCQTVWDKETLFWLDLPRHFPTPQNGFQNGRPNYGEVHDPNARTLNTFCTHAGLFSTVDGLCRTLLNYQEKTGFISIVKADSANHKHRFSFGWDRVEDPSATLAGKGCGPSTFGHLGFTGTSIWIDPDLMKGHVILSNATKYYWYDKKGLNDIRRAIGEVVWEK